jgi:iron complex outermembrane receptor protein
MFGPFGEGAINNTGAALNANYFVNDALTLTSITGYGNLRSFSTGSTLFLTAAMQAAKDRGDAVNTPSSNEGRARSEFFTQELTATYTTEQLKGVLGLYYIDEDGSSRSTTADSPTIDQDRSTKATAAFAQGTYTVGAGVGLTAGIRYTEEKAQFTQYYRLLLRTSQTAGETFKSTTPKLGINWQATDNLLTYASWTKGFKSGGFNPIPPNANTGVAGAIGAPTPYNPEKVDSYEVGFKYTTPDSRFRINTALYRAEYEGLQLPVFFPGTSTIYTSNATGGVVEGIEMEPTWQVHRTLQLYGNASLTWGHYTGAFTCASQYGAFIDCSDKKLGSLIPRKYQAGFRYTPILPIPGALKFNATWNYHSKYFNNVANEGPLVQTPSAAIYNAGVTWTSPAEMFDVILDVRNVANKHYSLAGLQQSNATRPAVSAFPNSPREIMLRMAVSF